MGVLTASGGACDIIADLASAQGLEIPAFADRTADAIAEHLPPFAAARNPLDVTGYGLANTRNRGTRTAIDHALDIAVDDPGLDFVLFSGVNLPDARPPDEAMASLIEHRIDWLAERMSSSPIPVIPIGSTCVDLSGYGRELLTRTGIHVLGGLGTGINALGNALHWLENRGRVQPVSQAMAAPGRSVSLSGPWSEAAARQLLTSAGVPVVPGGLATSAGEAVEIAHRVGLPVALKVCSAQITHKSDIGGVALSLTSESDIRAAYEKVRAAADAVPSASVDGVLVTAMRSGGAELLAGVTVDPTFGPVLAVGLGGVFVEVLRDTSLRVLPVDAAEVRRMLGELRGLPVLEGARGRRPADLDAVAEAITGLAATALSLGSALRTLEVNPLWVDGDQVEALDVLVVTDAEQGSIGL
jgi:acetate---CoA ligase (ADP-forming)